MPVVSGLHGPRPLTRANIGLIVGNGPGAYALGPVQTPGVLTVNYVGRSDADLIGRLGVHADAGHYSSFLYGFFDSAEAAYHKECALYHAFGETNLDNVIHPAAPAGSRLRCAHPRCNPKP